MKLDKSTEGAGGGVGVGGGVYAALAFPLGGLFAAAFGACVIIRAMVIRQIRAGRILFIVGRLSKRALNRTREMLAGNDEFRMTNDE